MEKPESMERGDRPGGYYLVLHEDAGYKVKQFVVRPGSRLSLQRHRHRAEHWQVVRGEATVTLGKEQVRLAPWGSIDIPRGALPRGGGGGVRGRRRHRAVRGRLRACGAGTGFRPSENEVTKVLSSAKINISTDRDVAQPGSALAWGARGRWFESSRPDQDPTRGYETGSRGPPRQGAAPPQPLAVPRPSVAGREDLPPRLLRRRHAHRLRQSRGERHPAGKDDRPARLRGQAGGGP